MGILLSQHICNVRNYSVAIGQSMNLSEKELDELSIASMFHDIGKYKILDIIEKPGKLTKEEFAKVKQHPVTGADIFKELEVSERIVEGILHHHERFDGGGYPSGISGYSIPLYSRIICVADSFDAITSKRTYKNESELWMGVRELKINKNIQFDPKIVDIFVDNKLYLRENQLKIIC